MSKVVKFIIQIAVGVAMGIMVNDFTKKYIAKPLQKFMDSLSEKSQK